MEGEDSMIVSLIPFFSYCSVTVFVTDFVFVVIVNIAHWAKSYTMLELLLNSDFLTLELVIV